MFRKVLIASALLALPAIAFAAFPKPTGFVNDFAGVMSAGTKSRLEGTLRSFEGQTGVEVAVVTLPSLDEQPVEDVAVELYQQWGIGKKGKDEGVLFLIAPKEHRMRIEVGYGLEGAINDALAGRILDQAVIPHFKANDTDSGIALGTLAIVKAISDKEGLDFDIKGASGGAYTSTFELKQKRGPLKNIGSILMLLVAGYLFIRHPWLFLFFLASGMGRGGVGGRGFGGGFGGFGGGLSGGGGASRGW